MDSCSVRSHLQPQRHFHERDGFTQNRRQKIVIGGLGICVFAGEALHLCRGGLTVDKSCIDL